MIHSSIGSTLQFAEEPLKTWVELFEKHPNLELGSDPILIENLYDDLTDAHEVLKELGHSIKVGQISFRAVTRYHQLLDCMNEVQHSAEAICNKGYGSIQNTRMMSEKLQYCLRLLPELQQVLTRVSYGVSHTEQVTLAA